MNISSVRDLSIDLQEIFVDNSEKLISEILKKTIYFKDIDPLEKRKFIPLSPSLNAKFEPDQRIVIGELAKILSNNILGDKGSSNIFTKPLEEAQGKEEALRDLFSLGNRVHQFAKDFNFLLNHSSNSNHIIISRIVKLMIKLDKRGRNPKINEVFYEFKGESWSKIQVKFFEKNVFISSLSEEPKEGSLKKIHKVIWYKTGESSLLLAKIALKESNPIWEIELEKEKRLLRQFKGYEGILQIVDLPPEIQKFMKENFFMTEYSKDGDLFDYCSKNLDRVSTKEYIQEANKIFLGILEGLKKLHDNDIVHNDIKLENLMIMNSKGVLCDLGLAIEKDQYKKLSGSFAYLAPEKASAILEGLPPGAFNTGKPIDIWALGLCLYAILTGSGTPWMTLRGKDQIRHIVSRDNIEKFRKEIKKNVLKKSLQKIILGMLEYDFKKRITIEEALKRFKEYIESLPRKTTFYGDFDVESEIETKEKEDGEINNLFIKIQLKEGYGLVNIHSLALSILKRVNFSESERNIKKLKEIIIFYSKKNEINRLLENYHSLAVDILI